VSGLGLALETMAQMTGCVAGKRAKRCDDREEEAGGKRVERREER